MKTPQIFLMKSLQNFSWVYIKIVENFLNYMKISSFKTISIVFPSISVDQFPSIFFWISIHAPPEKRNLPLVDVGRKNIYGQLIIGPRKESWHVREREAFGSINKIQYFFAAASALTKAQHNGFFRPHFNALFKADFPIKCR